MDITCKLTGVRGPGVNSHIVPRSFYGFDTQDHKSAAIIKLQGESTRIQKSPVGEYDNQIVTKEGEAFFSEGDDYAFECLVKRGQEGHAYHDAKEILCLEVPGVDYCKLKLFFLSLLWRAGVTKRFMFRRVSLGTHEERLRKMILNKDPGEPSDYSVTLGIHKDTPSYGLPMIEPRSFRDADSGLNYYRFSLGHFIAHIKVDQRPPSELWEDFLLDPGLPLRFLILPEFKDSNLYASLKKEVRRIKGKGD